MEEKQKEMEFDRMSMISQASMAVMALKKSDITEVKSFANPPVGVKDVMMATLLLIGYPSKQADWKTAKTVLGNASLQKKVAELDFDKVPPEARKEAMEILSKYSVDQIKNISVATAAFYDWAVAVAHD